MVKHRIIIGANLGDEGKGTVVAHYAKHAEGPVLNVLTNGGAQRAHSILTEDGSFTFQHFGSGSYYGADNYFSRYFILNPMQFVKEYQDHVSRGIVFNKVYRDPECRWSTPFDMMANQIIEYLRKHDKQGSCGMGIWETVQRYQTTQLTIPFDLFIALSYIEKVEYILKIKDYYENKLPPIPEMWRMIWNEAFLIEHFIQDCETMYDLTTVHMDFSQYSEILYENGQGLLLCDRGKDIAGTTPSFTDSRNALEFIGSPRENVTLHYVTRPYLTRHGKGDLPLETKRQSISSEIEEDRTNHHNVFQDSFRYAPLDLMSLKNRVQVDFNKGFGTECHIELTHCDEMDRESEFRRAFKNVNTYDSALIK